MCSHHPLPNFTTFSSPQNETLCAFISSHSPDPPPLLLWKPLVYSQFWNFIEVESYNTWSFATDFFHLASCFQGSCPLWHVSVFLIIAILMDVKWYLQLWPADLCMYLVSFCRPPQWYFMRAGVGFQFEVSRPTTVPGRHLIFSKYLLNECRPPLLFRVKMWFSTYKLIFILPQAQHN